MPDDLPYRVRRSDRARHVRVLVDPHAGRRGRAAAPQPVLRGRRGGSELRPWIEDRLAAAQAVRDVVAARGAAVPYLGTELALRPQAGRTRAHQTRRRAARARRSGHSARRDRALVPAGGTRRDRPAPGRGGRRARRSYTKLTIRNQRTRWGSCTSGGALSFNWRLLLAPEPVLGYVIWHEACHLRVMDHSPRFWELVRTHCPDYPAHRRWLKLQGSTLVL